MLLFIRQQSTELSFLAFFWIYIIWFRFIGIHLFAWFSFKWTTKLHMCTNDGFQKVCQNETICKMPILSLNLINLVIHIGLLGYIFVLFSPNTLCHLALPSTALLSKNNSKIKSSQGWKVLCKIGQIGQGCV